MKKALALIAITVSCWKLEATVLTVNNTGGAQFTTIQSAVVAANPGDTIYICGSSTGYAGPTTRKSDLTFIGTGFNVMKQNALKSFVILLSL